MNNDDLSLRLSVGDAPARRIPVFWAVLAVLTLLKIAAAWLLEPCYDEGYYFYWSLFPQLSYFDHPPLTAWAMALSGAAFGDGVWTIRIWPLLAGTLVAFIGRDLGRRIFSPAAGDAAGILLLGVPAFAGNGILMTPDALFAPAWAAAVWFAWRALACERGGFGWWLAAGASAGIGLLAKYNMVLFFLGLGALWALSPGRRARIFWGAAAAGFMALLFFLPAIVWNARHDWISFRFQMGHGFVGKHPPWVTVPEYLGSLLLLVATPVIGLMAFRSAWRGLVPGEFPKKFLAVLFWTVVLFFAASAFKRSVGPNWPMLGFFTAFVLLAGDWSAFPRWAQTTAWASLAAIVLAGAAGLLCLALTPNIALRAIPRAEEFTGGRAFADAVLARKAETGAAFVCVARHQVFGRLAYFAPPLRGALWLPRDGRRRFPWIDDAAWRGQDALVVVKSDREADALRPYFEALEPAGEPAAAPRDPRRPVMRFFAGRRYRPGGTENGNES